MRLWISILDDALGRLDLAAVYGVFSEMSIPAGVIKAPLVSALRGRIDGLPPAIAGVYKELLSIFIRHTQVEPSLYSVECWSNRSRHVTRSVEYHLDNNEVLRKATGVVETPSYGLIFYIGPEKGDVGGTYFNPPIEGHWSDSRLFNRPDFGDVITEEGILVPFQAGRIVIFDGRCPHCVAPFPEFGRPRVAILCNIWPALDGTV
jgi:hypothetical protein